MENPVMSIKMASGAVIKIELFPSLCPNTVNSVINLANAGKYNGRNFYRVIKDFVMQTDCDVRKGFPDGCDYILNGEFSENGHTSEQPSFMKGVVGMAGYGGKSGVSGGPAFFIMTGDHPRLDGGYSVIGRVTEGMEEVMRINDVACKQIMHGDVAFHMPEKPEIMEKVSIETHGVTYPPPTTRPYTEEMLEKKKAFNEMLEANM